MKKGELTAAFCPQDTTGHFDDLANANVGFTTRRQFSLGRNAIPLMGHLYTDLFTQPRIMIDGGNVHIKLIRSPATFRVIRAETQIIGEVPPNYKMKTDSIKLYVSSIWNHADPPFGGGVKVQGQVQSTHALQGQGQRSN